MMGAQSLFDQFDKNKARFQKDKEGGKPLKRPRQGDEVNDDRATKGHAVDDIADMIAALSANMMTYASEFDSLKKTTVGLAKQVETHGREIGRMQSITEDFMNKTAAGLMETTTSSEARLTARVKDLTSKMEFSIQKLSDGIATTKKEILEQSTRRIQEEMAKPGARGLGGGGGGGGGGPPGGQFACYGNSRDVLDQCLLVIGGFARDARKSVIETRLRSLATELKENPVDILLSRPRPSVGFMRFVDKYAMWRFKTAFNGKSHMVDNSSATGGESRMWAQISRPREERERTAPLRKVMAIMRGMHKAKAFEDLDFYINYTSMVAYAGDRRVATIADGNISFDEAAWNAVMPNSCFKDFRAKYNA